MGRICHKCQTRAIYNFEGSKKGEYCKVHAEEGMVCVNNICCCYDSCTTVPSYNFKGSKRAAYCKNHARDGMLNVRSKRCLHVSCTKIPSYNFGGGKVAYCKQHAKDGMIDVKNKRLCSHNLCTTTPHYNFERSQTAAYCKRHAEDGMVNVSNRQCLHDSCAKQPRYSFEGRRPGLYCKQHAADGMVNAHRPQCSQDSCLMKPDFNFQGKKQGAFCKKHAEDDMVDTSARRPSPKARTIVGVDRRGPPDFVATACAGPTKGIIDGRGTNCLDVSPGVVLDKEPSNRPHQAILENGPVRRAAVVKMPYRAAISRSPPSPGSNVRLAENDGVDGTTAKRPRRRIYRKASPT